jgi:CheY-like chemotaxis protein
LNPEIPLILSSGYPTKEFKERINELGPQGFLSKPYNTSGLLQTVRKTLNGSKALHLA